MVVWTALESNPDVNNFVYSEFLSRNRVQLTFSIIGYDHSHPQAGCLTIVESCRCLQPGQGNSWIYYETSEGSAVPVSRIRSGIKCKQSINTNRIINKIHIDFHSMMTGVKRRMKDYWPTHQQFQKDYSIWINALIMPEEPLLSSMALLIQSKWRIFG